MEGALFLVLNSPFSRWQFVWLQRLPSRFRGGSRRLSFSSEVLKMYIELTIDLKNYEVEPFDLRLSNYHSVKKVVDIVWQAKSIPQPPREGYWVRIPNKQMILSGNDKLAEKGITTGDRFEIL